MQLFIIFKFLITGIKLVYLPLFQGLSPPAYLCLLVSHGARVTRTIRVHRWSLVPISLLVILLLAIYRVIVLLLLLLLLLRVRIPVIIRRSLPSLLVIHLLIIITGCCRVLLNARL